MTKKVYGLIVIAIILGTIMRGLRHDYQMVNKDCSTIRETVTGTIAYHNYERDRGEGQESEHPSYAVWLLPNEDSDATRTYESGSSVLYPRQPIILGCILSGSATQLNARIIRLDPSQSTWDKAFYNTTTYSTIPADLSGKTVVATITRPITTYQLRDTLPDMGRIGDCSAVSEVKSIEIL